MKPDDAITVYWSEDIKASHGVLLGCIDASGRAICVVMCCKTIPHILAEGMHIVGQLSPTQDLRNDLLHVYQTSNGFIFRHSRHVGRVIYFRPPNLRRKAILSVDGVAEHLESANLRDLVSPHVEASVQSDFTRPEARTIALRWAVERAGLARVPHSAEWPTRVQINSTRGGKEGSDSGPTNTVAPSGQTSCASPARDSLWKVGMRSALARQSVIRYRMLTQGHSASNNSTAAKVAYIRSLWCIANDVIVGAAVATFLQENAEMIAHALGNILSEYVITGARDTLIALNNNPGGLKLNADLGGFFCDAFLWFLMIWEEVFLAGLIHSLPLVIRCVAFSAYFGSTFALCAASDLVALAALHLFVFHSMTASIYRAHVNVLYSLFNIFRGKRYNVLRERIEPASYELDQLLIGTVLFTLAVFLFPTVLVYHVVCTCFRLGSIIVQAVLEVALTFMNHFPLFALMLRIKEPGRLPGGLIFKQLKEVAPETEYLRLENRPIAVARIFDDQKRYIRDVLSYYAILPLQIFSGHILMPYAAQDNRWPL